MEVQRSKVHLLPVVELLLIQTQVMTVKGIPVTFPNSLSCWGFVRHKVNQNQTYANTKLGIFNLLNLNGLGRTRKRMAACVPP